MCMYNNVVVFFKFAFMSYTNVQSGPNKSILCNLHSS